MPEIEYGTAINCGIAFIQHPGGACPAPVCYKGQAPGGPGPNHVCKVQAWQGWQEQVGHSEQFCGTQIFLAWNYNNLAF